MTHEEKFLSLVKISKDLIEDFNDFADDQAIVWAWEEIKGLRNLVEVLESDLTYAINN